MGCTNPFEQLIAALTFQAERAYKTFLYKCYKQEIKIIFNILNRVKQQGHENQKNTKLWPGIFFSSCEYDVISSLCMKVREMTRAS